MRTPSGFCTAFAVALLLSGCSKPSDEGPSAVAAASSAAAAASVRATASQEPILVDAGIASSVSSAAASEPSAPEPLPPFEPRKAKMVGHTSVVLKLEDKSGEKRAFRPAFRKGPTRYRGEIAAYRLGVALGIGERFYRAEPWEYPEHQLVALLSPADREAFLGAVLSSPQDSLACTSSTGSPCRHIAGAMVVWLNDLQLPEFHREPWTSRWRGWLSGTSAPEPTQQGLAAQFSDLVVFDWITGNFDRWSGGNLGTNTAGSTLYYIDNDGAFLDPMPQKSLAASKQRLLGTARFSRGFVSALRALQERGIDGAFGHDRRDRPLLTEPVLAGLRERLAFALAHVDAQIAEHGHDTVVCWP